MPKKYFQTINQKKYKLPIFFPDATRAVVKTLDLTDVEKTKTPGVLVNTFHLWINPGETIVTNFNGVREFMNWDKAVISDSGGFQVMSLIKNSGGKVTDKGIKFQPKDKPRMLLTPEDSIRIQFSLKTDLMVVLDDFTPPNATRKQAEETVKRTLKWAERCKKEYEKQSKKTGLKPYLIGVAQGGKYQDLREYCTKELVKIGFDGIGYGGWPINEKGEFDYESAQTIAESVPEDYLLYGLGIGMPEDIVGMHKLGYSIFDCVIPTRDARHGRLFVYTATSFEQIDVNKNNFYKFLYLPKKKYEKENEPISKICDCHTCKNYSLGYLNHLFKIGDMTAMRLATIHNLRFYSLLMEKL